MKNRKWLYLILGIGLFLVVSYFVKFKMPCGGCSARGCWDGVCDTRLIRLIVNRFNIILLTIIGSLVFFWRRQKVVFVLEMVFLVLLAAWWLKQPLGVLGL